MVNVTATSILNKNMENTIEEFEEYKLLKT